MNTIDILRSARALITEREDWCQGTESIDRNGLECSPFSQDSVCWCATGAILHIVDDLPRSIAAFKALAALLPSDSGKTAENVIAHWNDAPERTHAEVLAAFDRTIAKLEAQS